MNAILPSEQVRWFRDAVTTHARQVRQFCQSSRSRLELLKPKKQARAFAEYQEEARDLLASLKAAIRKSHWLQRAGKLNVEHLEAEAEWIHELIEAPLSVAQPRPAELVF